VGLGFRRKVKFSKTFFISSVLNNKDLVMPSSVVESFTYEPAKSKLRVNFLSGRVYDYLHVPEKVYEEMKESGSKGTFLNLRIKGAYPFRKVK
jgi:hypothetical protein